MDERQKHELAALCGTHIRFDCPMEYYTSFRLGGKASALFTAVDLEALQNLLGKLHDVRIPYLVVGNGSNLLVRDEGFNGIVILLREDLAKITRAEDDRELVLAGGGLSNGRLLRYCRDRALSGLEFLTGIPGTAGGAVAMNAGAFGRETGDVVEGIQIVDREGRIRLLDRQSIRFQYRTSSLPEGAVVTQVFFRLRADDSKRISERMADHRAMRKRRQPLDFPSAGSVFKNPPNDHAGRLIESVGLKGRRVGGAMISEIHANYIVNTGKAKASDVLELMALAQRIVKDETGIELEPEIMVVGG